LPVGVFGLVFFVLSDLARAPFCEILRELLFVNLAGTYFSLKKGLGPSKRGQKTPFEKKRGSRQMYNTKMSRPSFPLVSVGKISGKYQPIPNQNTESGNNSTKNGYYYAFL
jgi:hypothetical protein